MCELNTIIHFKHCVSHAIHNATLTSLNGVKHVKLRCTIHNFATNWHVYKVFVLANFVLVYDYKIYCTCMSIIVVMAV